MENKLTAKRESFWSLLTDSENNFNVFIPRIQRDYAQGRIDPETNQIRTHFFEAIFEAIQTGKEMDMNFIYGDIVPETNYFEPVDGQQRLTALFLIHYYFAMYSGELDNKKEVFSKFTYATREVTKGFCAHLIEDVRIDLPSLIAQNHEIKKNNENLPDKEKKALKTISSIIKDYYWFFEDLSRDPSISSMLVVLDTIEELAESFDESKINIKDVFNLLCDKEKCPLSFLYLNLGDAGLKDSIYIKMNARGKPLTHFENFKAQLDGYFVKKGEADFAKEFLNNINGKWSEFFWTPKYRDVLLDSKGHPKLTEDGKEVKEKTFDNHIMKFFRFIILNDYLCNIEDEALPSDTTSLRLLAEQLLHNENDITFTSHLFKDGFKKVLNTESTSEVITISTFKKINKVLTILWYRNKKENTIVFSDSFEFGKTYLDEESVFKDIIGKEKLKNYDRLILAYAEYAFLNKYGDENSDFTYSKELTHFLRVVYNLIQGTINLQLDRYIRILRAVNWLVENDIALSINEYFAKQLYPEKTVLNSFHNGQVLEEVIKADLILQNNAWKKIISDTEKHYFDGQLHSLLSFSGLLEYYDSQKSIYIQKNSNITELPKNTSLLSNCSEKSNLFKSFSEYFEKFKLLFDEKGLREELEEDSLFIRTLLCYGGENSFLLNYGAQGRCFLINNHRDFSFRRLLRDDNAGKRDLFKQLLDDIDISMSSKKNLEQIISKTSFDKVDKWKEVFVRNPEILSSIDTNDSNFVFSNKMRFIYFISKDEILLLRRKQTNSVNRELFSYGLFIELKKRGYPVKYQWATSESGDRYIYFVGKDSKQRQIVYEKDPNTQTFMFFVKIDNSSVLSADFDTVIDYIKKEI